MEVGMPEYEMAHIKPSLLAAAALYLSLKLVSDNEWTDTLKYYSTYTEEDVLPVVKSICKILMKMDSLKQQVMSFWYMLCCKIVKSVVE